MAGYGYLQDIVYAGQPAVEAYKKYARDLREAPGPVRLDAGAAGAAGAAGGSLGAPDPGLLLPGRLLSEDELQGLATGVGGGPSRAPSGGGRGRSGRDAAGTSSAPSSSAARRQGTLRYLDLTWNGELTPALRGVLERGPGAAGQRRPGHPGQGAHRARATTTPRSRGRRTARPSWSACAWWPSATRRSPPGAYDDTFLLAQARGTWQAMEDAGRWIVFVTLPEAGDTPAGAGAAERLRVFFERAAAAVQEGE